MAVYCFESKYLLLILWEAGRGQTNTIEAEQHGFVMLNSE
ncbi:hypothetical protein M107_2259 [Bacteroides fragilis str. 3725 D9(v)]|uniref:Uncharacterized protein n=1 Tax=Bacteroides fragilis str. 1007-1-F \|nr:hypothetical protein M101_1382 [Bacteroides fragilis str. 1007-1-F \